MSATHTTAPLTIDLSGARRVDTPEKGYRVSRCHGAYAWKGAAARPGCPICGGGMSTTTRMLRAEFTILEGDVLELAERQPGGLPASIAWELNEARRLRDQADHYEARVASGECEYDEATGYVWTLRAPYDWEVAGKYDAPVSPDARLRSGGIRPAALREAATKHEAKAAKYERRLAKLGGAL